MHLQFTYTPVLYSNGTMKLNLPSGEEFHFIFIPQAQQKAFKQAWTNRCLALIIRCLKTHLPRFLH